MILWGSRVREGKEPTNSMCNNEQMNNIELGVLNRVNNLLVDPQGRKEPKAKNPKRVRVS